MEENWGITVRIFFCISPKFVILSSRIPFFFVCPTKQSSQLLTLLLSAPNECRNAVRTIIPYNSHLMTELPSLPRYSLILSGMLVINHI